MEYFTPLLIIVFGFFFLFSVIIEPVYMMIYNRPVYVHLYFFPKQLQTRHQAILQREFRFYRNLPMNKKKYFEHRVNRFVENYNFIGREGFDVTPDVKLRVAATCVMLTFGMRKYLPDVFTTILIYPDVFLSANRQDYHKGEFNPKAGVVVFSWRHFLEGQEYDNDNLNLGLHEFAHVVHFDSLRKRRLGSSSVIYRDMFERIMQYITRPENRDKVMNAEYFRLYAYTNQYEFIAVILEYYFETPHVFRQKLPELYIMVGEMINSREA